MAPGSLKSTIKKVKEEWGDLKRKWVCNVRCVIVHAGVQETGVAVASGQVAREGRSRELYEGKSRDIERRACFICCQIQEAMHKLSSSDRAE